MPELPEVETTRRGLLPHIQGQQIEALVVRDYRLRWPIPRNLPGLVGGRTVRKIERRGKYLLFDCGNGWMILHLGMSGSVQVVPTATPAGKHDHVDMVLASGMTARLTDPRRFGALLWSSRDPHQHPLLIRLAPEPLDSGFDARWLHALTRKRRAAIKSVIMDNHIVVGVGNIYASESLFHAGIHPGLAANRVSLLRCEKLVIAIRETLIRAIEAGGSTLRNYVGAKGDPGNFQVSCFVYGREDSPCKVCGTAIRSMRQGQRTTFFCPRCQLR